MSFLDIEALRQGLDEIGLRASDEQIAKLDRFSEMLFKWNKTYNLTAISNKEDVLTHHILDSLAIIPAFKGYLKEGSSILDVGSGGGLPAIPLAIFCPEANVTMVDTVGKKAAFLTQVIVSLRLKNVKAINARVENLKDVSFDVITSRAFASLKLFSALTQNLLKEGGVWLALKGPHLEMEIQELEGTVEVKKSIPISVPFLDEKRFLVEMRVGK